MLTICNIHVLVDPSDITIFLSVFEKEPVTRCLDSIENLHFNIHASDWDIPWPAD